MANSPFPPITVTPGPGGVALTPQLIGDAVLAYPAQNGLPAAGPGGTPSFTQVSVNGTLQNVSAALEIQSSTGAFLLPRLAATQYRLNPGAQTFVPEPGMQVYDTTAELIYMYTGNPGNWAPVATIPPDGGVFGPNPCNDGSIPVWANAVGTFISDSVTKLNTATGNMTGVGTINAAVGSNSAPTYSFTGDTITGMYRIAADQIGFAGNGAAQFGIGTATTPGTTVNWLTVIGANTNANIAANCPIITTNTTGDADVDIAFMPHGATGGVALLANDGSAVSPLRFWNATNAHYSAIQAGNNSSNLTWTLPITAPTAGQVLSSSDTNGTLVWITGGNVNVSGSGTANAVPTFTGTAGNIENTLLLVAQTTGNITNGGSVASIQMGPQASFPAASAPTYSFNHGTDTGMYLEAAHTIGFASDSTLHMTVGSSAGIVAANYLQVTGGASASSKIVLTAIGSDTNISTDIINQGSGILGILSSSGSNVGSVGLYNQAATHYVGFSAPATIASNVLWILPNADGAANSFLQTNGSGTLSWVGITQNLLVATGTLTAAQFLGMYATPVQAIAAPGANKMIVIKDIVFEQTYVSTTYAAGGNITAQYGNTAHAGGPICSTAIAASAPNGLSAAGTQVFGATGVVPTTATSNAANTAIYLSNAGGAFTTGDGTFTFTITYSIVTTT